MRETLLIILFFVFAAASGQPSRHAYVDDDGVLRWDDDQSEIVGFGVNYSVPFAHAFRMAERMGIDHEEAIRQDVYHFARLDLDLYRVHVWDTEISDSVGNLLENEHLWLFDFAIHEMKKRGMRFVITPIAFWGNGWPEPDEDTPGFSNKYGKDACLTNPDAIEAQANYLEQFLYHKNSYTGIAYKDDPDVIAFEVSNEPHHGGSVEEVKAYINRMVSSMKKTGLQKPVFYNMSHSIHLADAYMEADVDGGTFQWYPSGLVANHALKGNYLPHVAEYKIPYEDHPGFKNKAKIVYEFDPADVSGNYMYPVMGRSFREAGLQLATQFAYDAMFLAPFNTNYGTHFMNLAYAPQKALSLKIASAVFHEIPRNADFGDFPENNVFGDVRVSYEQNLAEYLSENRFFYTNNTFSMPSDVSKLKEIAGFGSSPVVKYSGQGAYFLDEIESGIWRLEMMPDALWLMDPYSSVDPNVQKAAVLHAAHSITIHLPQLGDAFSAQAINDGNSLVAIADEGAIDLTPGVYLLRKKGVTTKIDVQSPFKNIVLNEFVAPASDLDTLLVQNKTSQSMNMSDEVEISFDVISAEKPDEVAVFVGEGHYHSRRFDAEEIVTNQYRVLLPEDFNRNQTLNYYIGVRQTGSGWRTFPSGIAGNPRDWDFSSRQSYRLDILPDDAPLLLWSADDYEFSASSWRQGIGVVPNSNRRVLSYHFSPDIANLANDEPFHAFKYYFKEKIAGRQKSILSKEKLVLKAKVRAGMPPVLHVSLIDKSGLVRKYQMKLNAHDEFYMVSLEDFDAGPIAIVPRSFPDYLPWFVGPGDATDFNMAEIEMVQIVLPAQEFEGVFGFYIDELWLE
ncbi:glycoside hydrolase 5 family protein [Marinilabilia salmonicolor]|uniref:hypothetical protein n=1 Tax=Marinilabilia salmonicolor TaxID=989 RepID=UPI0003128931|nr:hypothetical protein [Marinilabilia salmonicolor]